tara:strand:- start:272 stop:538 length:267 start_codon:yes stop_codon:yes gene_type:complete
MIKLSTAINQFLNSSKASHMLALGKLQNDWVNIVGQHIAESTAPSKIVDGRLYIICKNPTWKTELQYQKKELLIKINQSIKIKDIILI